MKNSNNMFNKKIIQFKVKINKKMKIILINNSVILINFKI